MPVGKFLVRNYALYIKYGPDYLKTQVCPVHNQTEFFLENGCFQYSGGYVINAKTVFFFH
jgi:hypothetical protein